jgi:gas vesicle protein
MTERAAKQAAAPKAPDAAPKVDPTRRSGTGTGAASAAAAGTKQPPQAGLDDLIQKYQRQTDLNIGQARNATAQYAKELEDEGTQLVASEKKRIAEKVDPYKDREARLLKQEKDSEGMGDKYLGLALLQAGAAMMTTPGGIGMALGKGVQVGSDRYIAGIEKINAAKEKFALAKDRLEDLRINRADMNERDVRDAEKEARSLNRQGKSLFYSGAKDELNMKDKQITAVLGLAADDLKTTRQIDAERQNTLIREGGANTRNKATTDAAMQSPERLAFLSALEKTKTKENPQGDPAAAYQSIIAMKREPVSIENLRKDWLDTAKKMEIQSSYPNIKTFEDYVAVFGGGAGGAGGDGFKVVGVRPAK